MYRIFAVVFSLLISSAANAINISTSDHFISAPSLAPALLNQITKLYVREVKPTGNATRGAVLFIHGGGTPSQVAFDIGYKDYSWMAYLAQEGFAVYALDLTGYGRSTRPVEMNNPCHLSEQDQQQFIPALINKTCAKTYSQALTTNESDWADIDAAVNFILARQKLKSLALIGWSQGGPRSLVYSQQHPEKINQLVLFAPAYGRDWPMQQPSNTKLTQLMGTQNRDEFNAGWNKQLGCSNQVDDAIRDPLWQAMLASDSLGATWGTGVRRAPEQIWHWGFNRTSAAKITKPTLLIVGEFDKQVLPDRVRELYEDLGSPKKVLVELGCSSHRANWETNHLTLFKASADWLKDQTISSKTRAVIKLGGTASTQVK
ncbi:alpha/beta hydrolase [Cellvibrio zantedeschiae]|uniref:Alpha/beta hydrolase n=1 Tax=Cellvibrio zantedeschiae TaxID=1237077 RepID=A0ABQ3BD93_9GAMM|nr:alpha/beta fold hydrolase [Cellvibrio zantedeschiae]GGY87387.1 alpha/beta hydrolase [Cellvibrio zantedeschiae]